MSNKPTPRFPTEHPSLTKIFSRGTKLPKKEFSTCSFFFLQRIASKPRGVNSENRDL